MKKTAKQIIFTALISVPLTVGGSMIILLNSDMPDLSELKGQETALILGAYIGMMSVWTINSLMKPLVTEKKEPGN